MKVLVLFSGGQDSTTCLFWAIETYGKENVQTLTINYRQKHLTEIDAASNILGKLDMKKQWTIIETNLLQKIGDSALVGISGDIFKKHRKGDLPASFVPGRNILFLSIAGALAYKMDAEAIVIGANAVDYSGYPDCRPMFIYSMENSLSNGLDISIRIKAPLLSLSKKEIIKLALNLPGCYDMLAFTQTCYLGIQPPCGKCPSCLVRQKGFEEAGVPDPLIERFKYGTR